MDALLLSLPGLGGETSAYHGGTSAPLFRTPGVWDGNAPYAPPEFSAALAWAFLILLGVMVFAVLLIIRAMRMRPPGPTPEQELIEEVHQNEDALAGMDDGSGKAPWERDPDWWRK